MEYLLTFLDRITEMILSQCTWTLKLKKRDSDFNNRALMESYANHLAGSYDFYFSSMILRSASLLSDEWENAEFANKSKQKFQIWVFEL